MKKELIAHLSELITESRWELFQKVIAHRTRHICVALEDIYQPHNASAVLRSCDVFGVSDVHIIEERNTYEISNNVALGSSKWLDLYRYSDAKNNSEACMNVLKERGYSIVATSPHSAEYNLEDLPLERPIALFFGTEKDGLSQSVLDKADCKVTIPMYGFTESLNLSVSAALALNRLTERLRTSEIPWQLTEEQRQDILIHWLKRSIRDGQRVAEEFKGRHGLL